MRQAHVKNVAFYWCVFFLIAALSQNRHTYATRAFRHAEKSGLKQTCNYKSAHEQGDVTGRLQGQMMCLMKIPPLLLS